MEKMVSNILNELSNFISHHGGLNEVTSVSNPVNKYVVIDGLPTKDKSTYCIHTSFGWIVFSRHYTEDSIVYPSAYGILSVKMDIDVFADAQLHGIHVDDIDSLFKD